MKKIVSIVLALSLCLSAIAAVAETAQLESTAIDVEASYEPVGIEVTSAAIGFTVPSDFVAVEVTEEQAAQGLLLNAANADQTWSLQVTLTQVGYEAMLAALSSTEGIEDVQEMIVNGINYLCYSVPASQSNIFVAFLGENSDQALAFNYIVPEGVDPGTVPFEIIGSLYEL